MTNEKYSLGFSGLSDLISLCLHFIHIFVVVIGKCVFFFQNTNTESFVVLVPLVRKMFTASVVLCL